MKSESDPRLEAFIGAELKKLPPVPAPRSLSPRVMAILEARVRLPWWQRAWWDWPMTAKAGFVLTALALAGVFGGSSLLLDFGSSQIAPSSVENVNGPNPSWGLLGVIANVGQILWDNFGQPYLLYFAVLAAAAYLVCAGAGTLFIRMAVRRN
jgi:hypothetical protein